MHLSCALAVSRCKIHPARHCSSRLQAQKEINLHIAFDGWALDDNPEDPLVLRLFYWLQGFCEIAPHHRYTVFSPMGADLSPPSGVVLAPIETPPGGLARARWEQRLLPRAADHAGVDLLCFGQRTSPIFSPVPTTFVQDLTPPTPPRGLSLRLGAALGFAGAQMATNALRAADHPAPAKPGSGLHVYPPFVDPAFGPTPHGHDQEIYRRFGLTHGYVLSHSPDPSALRALLAAWSWAAPSVGELSPLLILGLHPSVRQLAHKIAAEYDLQETVRLISGVGLDGLPAIYRGAQVLLHPGVSQTGMELRWAMASGTPVAAYESPSVDQLMGPAVYLVPAGDARALGAACLALLLDANVSKKLREAGQERAAIYQQADRPRRILDLLVQIARGEGGG